MLKKLYYYFLIRKSKLFNPSYYLRQYPDVRKDKIDPLWHFITIGWKEDRNPSANFNTKQYLDANPDVKLSGINPLLHYIKHGQNENRRLKPIFFEKHEFENLKFENLLYANASDPPNTFDIIIFPIIPWDFRFQRPQQIALELANLGHRIFYIDTNFCLGTQPKIHKLRGNIYSVRLSNNNQNCQFNTSLSEIDVSNLQASIQTLRDAFLINSATMIVDLPFWVDLVKSLKISHGWKLVYDCMDFHLGFSNHSFKAEMDEKKLIKKCDLVVATSHFLFDHVSKYTQNCAFISNGTDYESFHNAKDQTSIPELEKFSSPIIGYYGAIADWFDTHLVASLAIEKPEWTFLLIGDTYLADIKPLNGLKNVHLLGEKPISEIPNYLSNFDVCIIPFKDIPLTNATNPVKMYEYLSAGKPIVATRLDELSYYSDYLQLAKTEQEWIEAIKNSLSEIKTDELLNKRFNFAKENTWHIRAKSIQTEILKLYLKISIIVVSYNNLDYTRLCLESILKNTSYQNYEIIIVDNASDNDTVAFLIDYCSKNNIEKLILNQENLGFAKANNQGAKTSDGEYLVFLNNDTIVSPGWLHRLMWHLKSDKNIGMVGPVTNAISNEAKINIDYSDATIFNVNNFAAKQTMLNYGQSFAIKVLAMFCLMMTKELFFEVKGLDERYKIGIFAGDDLAIKIQKKGLRLLCAKDVFIHHVQK